MPHEVLEVVDGQDRGARFGVLPGESTIGRGRRMDVVLTDPSVAHLHARLRLGDEALVLEDLSGGGTRVNGTPPAGPARLAPDDRLELGDTGLRVLWAPGAPEPAAAEPARPEPARAQQPAPEEPVPEKPAPEPAPPEPVDLGPAAAGVALALSLLALVGTWLPFVATPAGSAETAWSLDPRGLGLQAVIVALVAVGGSGWWLAVALGNAPHADRELPRLVTTLAAAAVCGLPLFALTVPIGAGDRDVAVFLLLTCGIGTAALASVGGFARVELPETDRPRPGSVTVAAAAGFGGLLAAAASPLAWFSTNVTTVGGLDAGLRAGRLLLPLGLVTAMVAALTAIAPLAGQRRAEGSLAAATAALGIAGLTLTTATALAFSSLDAKAGLLLALLGTAVAAAGGAGGALWLVRDPSWTGQPAGPAGAERTAP